MRGSGFHECLHIFPPTDKEPVESILESCNLFDKLFGGQWIVSYGTTSKILVV